MKNNNTTLFRGAIVVAVMCLAVSIYYNSHLLVTHDVTSSHPTHAFAFFALAIIGAIAALVTRPKATSQLEHGEQ